MRGRRYDPEVLLSQGTSVLSQGVSVAIPDVDGRRRYGAVRYSGLRYIAESARIPRACHVWPQPRGTCRTSPGMDFLPIIWLNFSTKRHLLQNHILPEDLGHQVLHTTLLGGQVADEPIG